LAEERDKAVERLSAHFAADHLEISELERRLDLVYSAGSPAELADLVADLPALSVDAEPEVAPSVRVEPWRAVARTQTMVAVMGGAERKGQWTPPRHMNVVAVMGGGKLDFREAIFGESVTEVTIVVFMGGVEIIVPPGMHGRRRDEGPPAGRDRAGGAQAGQAREEPATAPARPGRLIPDPADRFERGSRSSGHPFRCSLTPLEAPRYCQPPRRFTGG
jgi:hypothetical protein